MKRNSKGQFVKNASTNDLVGQKFGYLTVLDEPVIRKGRRKYLKCVCKCDNIGEYRTDCLKSGNTLSCGCLKAEQDKKNLVTKHFKHHMARTNIYRRYYNMRARCYNSNHKNYPLYGGRGIKMCDEWYNNFENFMEWALESGYHNNLQIDRIDSNGNYEPSNCRWITGKRNSNNKRNNIKVIVNEENLTLAEIADKYNFEYETIRRRYSKGDRNQQLIRPLKRILKKQI